MITTIADVARAFNEVAWVVGLNIRLMDRLARGIVCYADALQCQYTTPAQRAAWRAEMSGPQPLRLVG